MSETPQSSADTGTPASGSPEAAPTPLTTNPPSVAPTSSPTTEASGELDDPATVPIAQGSPTSVSAAPQSATPQSVAPLSSSAPLAPSPQATPQFGPRPPQPARPPLGAATTAESASARQPRFAPAWLVACGLGALVVIAIVQMVVLVNVNGDLGAERKRNRELAERTDALEEAAAAFDERILRIEGRTSGILNATEVARQVLPSVFQVEAGDAVGTAFALGDRPKGGGALLVTNFHVVQGVVDAGGEDVTVKRQDRSYRAEIVGSDKGMDLAVLRTEREFPRLKAAAGELSAGDPLVVVGAPLGLSDTVTTGVVSAIRDSEAGDAAAIQFDAAISPGNSGGPVVNADGEVVGIATAKVVENDADGIGFAIPVAAVCERLIDC